jgi:preprotein translocase subunit SecB
MAESEKKSEKQFMVQRIYTKDLSYESPNAPDIFREDWRPQHELNLNAKVNKLSDDTYEVVLSITVTSKIGDKTALIVEVHQAGLFGVQGFPENELGPLLGAYCPNLLFPYAREAVSDLVTKGSFPQLVLQPVNFDAMFAQHEQQMAEQIKGQAESGSPRH